MKTLKGLVRGICLDILFLSETKIKSPKLGKIKNKLVYENLFCVDSVGKAGGLALM